MIKHMNIDDFNSFEEFIYKMKRYPQTEEARALYSSLWKRYIANASSKEKKIALENDSLTQQSDIIPRIKISAERLNELMKKEKKVLKVGYYERWGSYKLLVQLDVSEKKNLYKYRKVIPIFFEGWEVELSPAKPIDKIIFWIKKILAG